MEWYDNYNSGVKLIDEQHLKLVQMISELQEAHSTESEKRITGKTIKFLVDYTRTHLSYEEDLMIKSGYPGDKRKAPCMSFRQVFSRNDNEACCYLSNLTRRAGWYAD